LAFVDYPISQLVAIDMPASRQRRIVCKRQIPVEELGKKIGQLVFESRIQGAIQLVWIAL
jgi:hypothetical protein